MIVVTYWVSTPDEAKHAEEVGWIVASLKALEPAIARAGKVKEPRRRRRNPVIQSADGEHIR